MYKVNPFIWHDLSEKETFFQTKLSSIIITNKNLVRMLKYLEKNEVINFEESLLSNYFRSNMINNVLVFLEENKLIKKLDIENNKVNEVLVYTDDSEFSELFDYVFSEKFTISHQSSISHLESKNMDGKLLIVFLKAFNFKEYENIVNIAKEKNVVIKIIFSYNHHIYFSNFYKREWYNPCPICFFSELESQLRGEITSDTANFQTIIDLLYTKSQNFAIEYPLQKDDYFTIVYTIMRNLDSDLMKCDLDEVLSIDLNNHLVSKDIAYHWGYCDCYE
ncbi:TPA: McbB family protein [Enterococcus faecalis]|uniref:McbB family protein n=1 Tax=Enterococcus TaxID=1350 RepID=UPI0012E1FCA5|nr:McbB family protein [Enterococcus faecalis]